MSSGRCVLWRCITGILMVIAAAAPLAGAKDSAKDSEGTTDGMRRLESPMRAVPDHHQRILEENRALKEENAFLRQQLAEMDRILKSFDERLSALSASDRTSRPKWNLGRGLSDAFRPAAATPLLDSGASSTRTPGSVSPSRRPFAQGLDLTPSNPVGMPGTGGESRGGSNSLYLSTGMFKDILAPVSNLEIGYLYQFGTLINTGRLTFDYVLPARAANRSAAFGEAHAEFTNFGQTLQRIFTSRNPETSREGAFNVQRSGSTTTERGYRDRIDLSCGGGYRRILGDNLLLGVNGFGDVTMVGGQWYGSGGLGFEMAALGAGNDLVELNFNYYGNIFQGRNSIVNAFRNGPANYDASIAYSLQIGADGPDLRCKLTGYRFDTGTARYGLNVDAELKSKDGLYSVKAGTGHDPVNGWYHTVGGFVNLGVRFSRLLNGESPFTMPEPIFKSPRNLRRLLTRKVDRNSMSPPASAARSGVTIIGSTCAVLCDPPAGEFRSVSVAQVVDTVQPGAPIEATFDKPVFIVERRNQSNPESLNYLYACVQNAPSVGLVPVRIRFYRPYILDRSIYIHTGHTTGDDTFQAYGVRRDLYFSHARIISNNGPWTPGCITVYSVRPY